MSESRKSRKTDTIFVLLLFCLFAAVALTSLTLGGSIYKSIVDKSQYAYDERVCLSYIWTKLKRGDEAGRVHIGDFNGISALYIDEEYDETIYQTVIYIHNGWVLELFCEKGLNFDPDDGTRIIQADSLSFEQDDSLITAEVNGKRLLISIRSATADSVSTVKQHDY